MNLGNIEKLYRYFFKKDKITRQDVYTNLQEVIHSDGSEVIEYELKDSFIDYVEKIRDRFNFYEFCLKILQRERMNEPEREKEIIKEIRESETEADENDLEDSDFIYNWYLENRLEHCLYENLDFFLDIIDELNESK
jgi:hypothetical protein